MLDSSIQSELVNHFLNLTAKFKCPVGGLDSGLVYYYADDIQSDVYLNSSTGSNIYELDVESAFPTICRFLYGSDHWFVQQIFEHNDKLERNKFIAITLTHNKSNDLNYKISDLNVWSKIIVLLYMYSKYEDPFILEFKKDGVLFTSQGISNSYENIISILEEFEFRFHEDELDQYLRLHRTSFYVRNEEVKVKGQFKNLPLKLKEIINTFLINPNSIYDQNFLKEIKKLYTSLYYNILLLKGLYTDISTIYEFHPLKFISYDGTLKQVSSIYQCKDVLKPEQYLYTLIYPIMSLLK